MKKIKLTIFKLTNLVAILRLFIGSLIFFFLFVPNVFAKETFLVSFKTDVFAPDFYQGKKLPTFGSNVFVSFNLIDNGRLANLSKTKIRWYLNDELIINEKNGLGIQTFEFQVPEFGDKQTEITITLFDYKGKVVSHSINIPIVSPEVVIDNHYPENIVPIGSSYFKAYPFFFNIKDEKDVLVDWFLNNQRVNIGQEDPFSFKLEIAPETPSGYIFNLKAAIYNLKNKLESAFKNIRLSVK